MQVVRCAPKPSSPGPELAANKLDPLAGGPVNSRIREPASVTVKDNFERQWLIKTREVGGKLARSFGCWVLTVDSLRAHMRGS